MKTTIIILIAILLFGCTKPSCSTGKPHEWTKWENEWEQTNHSGFMRQTRSCVVCGMHDTYNAQ